MCRRTDRAVMGSNGDLGECCKLGTNISISYQRDVVLYQRPFDGRCWSALVTVNKRKKSLAGSKGEK